MGSTQGQSSNHLRDEDIIPTMDEKYHKSLWDTALSHPPTAAQRADEIGGIQESSRVLPTPASLEKARSSLVTRLPPNGRGYTETKEHLCQDIVPGLNKSSISPNYYGFVTGGVTPAALLADNIVSAYDQNVQVHLAEHSVSTDVEVAALGLLMDLFELERDEWPYSIFTSGATASNVLGLACGREFVLRRAVEKRETERGADGNGVNGSITDSVGEYGVTAVLEAAGLRGLQILSTLPHSSLGKAAGMLGIGRANIKSICAESIDDGGDKMLKFDYERLEHELARSDIASIVAISYGEVNTGRFATGGMQEFKRIRALCDKYDAWLHVDAAFGIFARVLEDGPEFDRVKKGCEGLELADSITGDAHKLLNVPYDCGFFFSRHGNIAEEVFRNPNAAYLSSGDNKNKSTLSAATVSIPSPLNIGIENSRRFRALPVYASLVAYGKDGYRAMLERQIRLARRITSWLFDHPKYTALPRGESKEALLEATYIIVLFKADDEVVNEELAKRINSSSKIFVSGTKWEGESACRIAISNWKVQVEREFSLVTEVLEEILK